MGFGWGLWVEGCVLCYVMFVSIGCLSYAMSICSMPLIFPGCFRRSLCLRARDFLYHDHGH